ncbi:MAG: cell wall-binding repeat-containing protein [Euzebya sp.]
MPTCPFTAARSSMVVLTVFAVLLLPSVSAGATDFQQLSGEPVRLAGGSGDTSGSGTADNSNFGSITPDGRFVAFNSTVALTPSVTQTGENVFVYDTVEGIFELITALPNGRSGGGAAGFTAPQISHDGRYVAFLSRNERLDADYEDSTANQQDVLFLRDRQAQQTTLITVNGAGETFGAEGSIAIAGDGSRLAYSTDGNPFELCGDFASRGVYAFTVASAQHTLISADTAGCIPSGGRSESPDLNGDGSILTFASEADAIGGIDSSGNTDVWVADFTNGGYENLTATADAGSTIPSVSADGRYVAFQTQTGVYDSRDTNFREDIYLRDRVDGTTRLLSIAPGATGPGTEGSFAPQLSANAAHVLFQSPNELAGPAEPPETVDTQTGIYRVSIAGGEVVRGDLRAGATLPTSGFTAHSRAVADNGSVVFETSNPDYQEGDSRGGFFYVPDAAGAPPPDGGTPPPPPPDPTGPTPAELDDAINAAIGVSQNRFPELHGGTADYGVLATVENFADALSGAVLAQQGPLLLTRSSELNLGALEEFDRVLTGSATIYVLGGEAALSERVELELSQRGYTVQRLMGASRFETSTAIATQARALFGDTGEVAIARAFGPEGNPTAAWADSVTGGGYAANTGTPIVLTPTEGVHPAAQSFLDADSPATIHLLGGEAALAAVYDTLPGARRTAGATRFDTARQIAAQLWQQPETGPRRYLILDATRELGWAYGLPAAGVAADADVPFLAVGQTNPPETLEAVAGCDDQVVVVNVGPITVTQFDELKAQDDAPCPGG